MAPRYYRTQQPKGLSHVLNVEIDANYSRDEVTYAAPGADQTTEYEPGTVLGRIMLNSTIATAKTGTGNGARSNVALGPAAQSGVYRAVYVDDTAFLWDVFDPAGAFIGQATNGALFESPQIEFQIAQGGTVWVEGDLVEFTVSVGSKKAVPIDFAATDGSQNFYAIAGAYCVVEGTTDQKSFAIARGAVLVQEQLVWPEGATDAQKAAALAQAETRGLIARRSA